MHGDVSSIMGVMNEEMVFERLAGTVYVAARAGAVDCTDAFDLAASTLKLGGGIPEATELASLSLECTQGGRRRMAEVALRMLAAVNFNPGFAEEPGWLAGLEDACKDHEMSISDARQASPAQAYQCLAQEKTCGR